MENDGKQIDMSFLVKTYSVHCVPIKWKWSLIENTRWTKWLTKWSAMKPKFVIKSQASNQCLTQSVALYACVCALARSKASKYIENETNFQHRIKCSRWLLEFQALNLEKCSLSRDRFTWLWSISLRAWEIDWTNVCLCLCLCMLCITIYCLYSTSFNAVKR